MNGEIKVTSLKAVGETTVATFMIRNKEKDLAAKITQGDIEVGKGTIYDVTTNVGSDFVLELNNQKEVKVTVKLKKIPLDEEDSQESTISVKFIAIAQEPAS